MIAASIPPSRGIGTMSVDTLPRNLFAIPDVPSEPLSADPARSDGVTLSGAASASLLAGAIDLSALDPSDEDGLAAAARNAFDLLAGNARLAESSFGKSAMLLVRASVELEKNGSLDALPEDGKVRLARAAESARAFLAEHPRVADSPLGASVAKMAGAVVAAIGTDDGGGRIRLADWLMEAARRAELYFEEYPALAGMPLGEAVSSLIDGVKALADGNPLDADLQTLAKRVGYFLQQHPRLAQSEFGQLVAPLGRGLAAIDVSALPEAEPPAEGKFVSARETAVVLDMKTDEGDDAMRKAA